MNITVNGEPVNLDKALNISQLLEFLGYQNRFVAVAKNHTSIPKSTYQNTYINENDNIEILAPMSGG